MKAFFTALTLLAPLLLGATTAQAHPGHYPVELVTSFNKGSSVYNVWNTHRRGFFGTELIEIRDQRGGLKASWWASNGWCFTEHAYSDYGCYSESGYTALFNQQMNRFGNRNVMLDTGGPRAADDYVFCDHYTQLEYTVSGDTSGVCDHEDGLPLPAWATD